MNSTTDMIDKIEECAFSIQEDKNILNKEIFLDALKTLQDKYLEVLNEENKKRYDYANYGE